MSSGATAVPTDALSQHVPWLVWGVERSSARHIGKLPVAIPVLREALGVSLVQAGVLLSMTHPAGMSQQVQCLILPERCAHR